MDQLDELLCNPEKYELSPQAIDGLHELKRVFERNPFFPIEPYVYA